MKKTNILLILLLIFPFFIYDFLQLREPINLILILIILIIFIFSFVYKIKNSKNIIMELDKTNEKLVNTENDIDVIFSETKILKKVWIEYKMKMFEGKTKINPEEFFNESRLFNGKINFYFYNYIPNLFITIGIMGTFLGLSLGLKNLVIVDIFSINNGNFIRNNKKIIKKCFYIILYEPIWYVLFNIILYRK